MLCESLVEVVGTVVSAAGFVCLRDSVDFDLSVLVRRDELDEELFNEGWVVFLAAVAPLPLVAMLVTLVDLRSFVVDVAVVAVEEFDGLLLCCC